jgi:hypothetical protein
MDREITEVISRTIERRIVPPRRNELCYSIAAPHAGLLAGAAWQHRKSAPVRWRWWVSRMDA